MKRSKPPAFQFYVKDWLASARVRGMSWAGRGLYIELLALCWDGDGLPLEPEAIRQLAHVEKRDWQRLWPQIASAFPVRKTRRMNPKLAKIRREFKKMSDGGKLGNRIRWNGLQSSPPDSPTRQPPRLARPVGGGESTAVAVASAVAGKSKTLRSAPAAPRETWLTPFGTTWQVAYGGDPAYGELAKHLHPLVVQHDHGEVLEHWGRYLEATDAQFVSPARFAQTYGRWGKPERPTRDHLPDMYLTLEEQAARRAKLAGTPAPSEGPEHVAAVLARVLPRTP
jgi:hypothetical protein